MGWVDGLYYGYTATADQERERAHAKADAYDALLPFIVANQPATVTETFGTLGQHHRQSAISAAFFQLMRERKIALTPDRHIVLRTA